MRLLELALHEPDLATIEPLAAVVRRLGRGLAGRVVYPAGEFRTLPGVAPSTDKEPPRPRPLQRGIMLSGVSG